MKILYIGKFEPYWRTENKVTTALRSHGIEVSCQRLYPQTTIHDIKSTLKAGQFDVLFFSKVSKWWFEKLIEWCRSEGIQTAAWIFDLYIGHRDKLTPQFWSDVVFTTDGGHDATWRQLGINHRLLRQGIPAIELKQYDRPKKYDVGFVGGLYPLQAYAERRHLLRAFVRVHGKRFIRIENKRGLILTAAIARIKIMLASSVSSPSYWSNRVYEMIGRGGFVLHPESEGLREEFTADELVTYSSAGEALDLTQYYLQHEDERNAIQQAGFSRMKEHTYEKRVETVIDYLRKNPARD